MTCMHLKISSIKNKTDILSCHIPLELIQVFWFCSDLEYWPLFYCELFGYIHDYYQISQEQATYHSVHLYHYIYQLVM